MIQYEYQYRFSMRADYIPGNATYKGQIQESCSGFTWAEIPICVTKAFTDEKVSEFGPVCHSLQQGLTVFRANCVKISQGLGAFSIPQASSWLLSFS